MNPLIGALVLITLALLGARFSFSTERVPPGPRLLFRTGIHFLILGFLLGPVGLGLLTEEATRQLLPFLALGLGWVGFHFGLQLDLESLRAFPWSYHALSLGQAVFVFGIVAIVGALLFPDAPRILVLGAAATASVTTPAGIAMISANFMVRGNVRDLLFFIGSLDAGVGIVALQVAYSIYRPETAPAGTADASLAALLGIAVGLGLVCGIVFVWLSRSRPETEELVLYLLGISAFCAGAALHWGLSPLFVSVVMGATVANLDRSRTRILSLLQRWEKPVYLTFLLVAGALLQLPTPWAFALAGLYAVVRGTAKAVGTAAFVTVLPFSFDLPKRAGLGLIPQGGIALAMAVSGVLLYPDVTVGELDAEATLFAVIVIGVVLSELVGPFLTLTVLRRAGEVTPEVERALAQGDERRAEREALRRQTRPD